MLLLSWLLAGMGLTRRDDDEDDGGSDNNPPSINEGPVVPSGSRGVLLS